MKQRSKNFLCLLLLIVLAVLICTVSSQQQEGTQASTVESTTTKSNQNKQKDDDKESNIVFTSVEEEEQADVIIEKIIVIDENGQTKETTLDQLDKAGIEDSIKKQIENFVHKPAVKLDKKKAVESANILPSLKVVDSNVFEASSLIRSDQDEIFDTRTKLFMLKTTHSTLENLFKKDEVSENSNNTVVEDEDDATKLERKKNEIRATYKGKKAMRIATRLAQLHSELMETKMLIRESPYLDANVTKAVSAYLAIARKYPEDALALFNLGVIHETNKFGKLDFSLSKQYVLAAALKGHSIAQFSAGYLYGNKLVTKSDIESVKQLLHDLYNNNNEYQIAQQVTTSGEELTEDQVLEKEIQEEVHKEEWLEKIQKNKDILEKLSTSIVDYDPDALAVSNYFASALSGYFKSLVALGYRHLYGYGVPKSCQTAAYYYQQAAQLVKAEFEDGMTPMIEKIRLTDEAAKESKQNQDDVMDYYQYSADKGSTSSQLIVGYAHMYGLRGFARNGELARQFFQRAADAGEPEAYAALGNMYWKGIGVAQNNETAYNLFKKGADKGDPASQYGLGSMYLSGAVPTPHQPLETTAGIATPAQPADQTAEAVHEAQTQGESNIPPPISSFTLAKDPKLAAQYFNMSANQGNPDAQYKLGMLYMTGVGVEQNYFSAIRYFSQAAQQGQTLARYHLGTLNKDGLGTPKNCNSAVRFFKYVVEKASWLSAMDQAYESYTKGNDYHTALSIYHQLAELGVEVAQSNAAYMFDRGYGVKHFIIGSSSSEQLQRALSLYKKAAEQGNVEAYVKVGDYYYYGTSGLTNAVSGNATSYNTTAQYEKSVYHYRRAADLRNAQAMFNLGIMHEHGLGLPQDFHLAKRYYDMAAETDPVAVVPVYMALGKLFAHWGFAIVRNYVKSLVGIQTVPIASSNIADAPSTAEESAKSAILSYIASLLESLKNLSWESIVNFVMRFEDRILAVLIGLFLFLLFVRYVYVNNVNERRMRQQMREQRQVQETEDEEPQVEHYEGGEH